MRVGIQNGFFENTFLGVEELANERIVESGLPLLNEGHFEAAIVCSVGVDWDWSPNVQVVVVKPIAKCQLCLDKSLVCELEVFSGATVLSVEGVVHCRAHIEFGLHVGNVSETDVDALSHGEGGQNVDDENHRMENVQMGLKHLVPEFATKKRC